MALRDVAQRIEDGLNRRGIVRKRKKGWHPRVIPFVGYGSTEVLHVLARVVMADPSDGFEPIDSKKQQTPFSIDPQVTALETQRGWRQFFTTQVGFIKVNVLVGEKIVTTTTNRGGYIDVLVENHNLEPGWNTVEIIPIAGAPAKAQVIIVGEDVTTGIVSDIDDTIIVTWLPRILLAGWNSFVRHSSKRKPVEGMASLFQHIIAKNPGTPCFYISTGAWNTLPTMQVFAKRHGFPTGPMLLTDWGPNPTGLFRNGAEHKRVQIRNIFITFPNIRWILVGDNGQHDPIIYGETGVEHSRHVEAIAIRELSPIEQVLSHGTFDTLDLASDRQVKLDSRTPIYIAPDGNGIWEKMRDNIWKN